MRTNRKCNNYRCTLAPAKGIFCFPSEHIVPEGPEYEKYQHNINRLGEVLPNPE